MKAILLVAGRGSRLGKLTDNKPKSLVELNGKTLLQRAVNSLREGGVSEIAAVGGYRSDMVSPYADRLFINDAWHSTSILSSLLCAREWLRKEICIISYGDIFYSPALVEDLINSPGEINLTYDPNAVTLWQQRNEDPIGDLETFSIYNNKIIDIGGKVKNIDDVNGQYMGLFKITPKGWDWIETYLTSVENIDVGKIDMTGLFSRLIKNGNTIYGTENSMPWGEIDTPSDIELYKKIYPYV